MFPRPTAEPAAARMKPTRVAQVSRAIASQSLVTE
jgi:hypothetical protein